MLPLLLHKPYTCKVVAGSNQICNFLPMIFNHVPLYNEHVQEGDFRYKSKIVNADPKFDVDKFVIGHTN